MKRRITLDGVLATFAFAVVVAYLVNPQFVAGIAWDFFSGLFILAGWR